MPAAGQENRNRVCHFSMGCGPIPSLFPLILYVLEYDYLVMAEMVTVDDKGRIVLPRKIRKQAQIGTNVKLVAYVSGPGKVELSDPVVLLAKAREIGAKKLAGWKEEDHNATASMMRTQKDSHEDD